LRKAEVKEKSLMEIELEIQEARRVAEEQEAREESERVALDKAKRNSKREELNVVWKAPVEAVAVPDDKNVLSEKENRAARKKALNARWTAAASGSRVEDV
jgi:hypothetical protein